MTRMLFGLLSFGLLLCWLLGFARGTPGWWLWADFVAGSFAFLVAVSPVFSGEYGKGNMAPYGYGLSAALALAFAGNVLMGSPAWLTWTTLLFAVFSLAIGLFFSAVYGTGPLFGGPRNQRNARNTAAPTISR